MSEDVIIERFAAPHGARQCADMIARRVLGQHVEITRLPSGAPVVSGCEGCYISISHTADYLAFMVSDRACGVDIELVDRGVEKVEKRFASRQEKEACREVFPQNPSLLVWCVKEAIYKSLGREGVDFLRDMTIECCQQDIVWAYAFAKRIALRWSVVEQGRILMVKTIQEPSIFKLLTIFIALTETQVHLRWGDIDMLGHVYNGYYQHYYDAGKSDYFNQLLDLPSSLSEEGVGMVTANTNTNFYDSILPHNKINIRTFVEKVGTKSIRVFQQIVDRKTGLVKSDSRSVMVCIDRVGGHSVEIPARWRAALREETLPER